MSNYVVSARKYRPATFDEVVGQDHVAKTLKNALQTDKLAHAFLFCGPRGVGKTTSARILAKVINCGNPQNNGVDSCNECAFCQSFNENASFNIIELDAASNNSVEHIRTLIDQVRFKPQQGSYKVFIIDEVHMLSNQAFNAFLKTLEEPPPYAIFILATTEKHKIIPTILSRCQIFDFKRITVENVVEQLKQINEKEGRKAEEEALYLIGQKADGAMRDALSIYDKIASAAGEMITYKDVVDNLNLLDYEHYFTIIDTLLQKDLAKALVNLDEVIRKGFEPELILDGLADHFRNLLVAKDPRTITLIEGGDQLKERYYNQSQLATRSFLLSSLSILNDTMTALPRANNKRLLFEVAISKINHLNDLLSVELIAEKKTLAQSSSPSQESKSSNPPKAPENRSTSIGKQDSFDQKNAAEEEKVQVSEDNKEASDTQNTNDPEAVPAVVNTPQFSNFKNLISKIREEEEVKKVNSKNLSIEVVQRIWQEHLSGLDSKRIETALKLAEQELDNVTLSVYVPNPISKEIILQETILMEKIRKETGVDALILNVEVSKERFPGWEEMKTKKVLTNKEKYEQMVEKNPALANLRRVFDLKVDKDGG